MPPVDPRRVEGVLLDPFLPPEEARRKLSSWKELGLSGAVLSTALLAQIGTEDHGVRLFGCVGFPWGTTTLTNKRVELLEVFRLGGVGAEIVLTPYLVSEGHMGGLEKEMKALLETAPELEVRFAVEWDRLGTTARAKFIRLLRDFPPAVLRSSLDLSAPQGGEVALKGLKPLLPKKVRLKVHAPAAQAEGLLAAGADLVECDRPEKVVGGGP